MSDRVAYSRAWLPRARAALRLPRDGASIAVAGDLAARATHLGIRVAVADVLVEELSFRWSGRELPNHRFGHVAVEIDFAAHERDRELAAGRVVAEAADHRGRHGRSSIGIYNHQSSQSFLQFACDP